MLTYYYLHQSHCPSTKKCRGNVLVTDNANVYLVFYNILALFLLFLHDMGEPLGNYINDYRELIH